MIERKTLLQDFPILEQTVHGGRRLIYLDSAATSQKPRAVIEAVRRYYEEDNANVHRAIHTLGERATRKFEEAREKVARFIGAPDPAGVIFTKSATEALNLVAYSWGYTHLKPGDEILLSPMEHHSNLVPWQRIAQVTGARLAFFPLTSDGRLALEGDALQRLIGDRTRVVAVTHQSNVLGTINPVAAIAEAAHRKGAVVVVDGAQSVPHMAVDVAQLGCDFLAFSGHKMLGPTGIGVLWGRKELLDAMEPFLGGGEMIDEVFLDHSTFRAAPYRFEAGTPNIAGAIGLGAAIDYLQALGMESVRRHEEELVDLAMERLSSIEGVTIYGPRRGRGGLVSFNVEGIHPHDLSTILDAEGIAVRAGHHCAQPLMRHLQVPATVRASFYIYNGAADVEALVRAIAVAKGYFNRVP